MNLQQSKHLLKVRMGYEITTSTGHTWTAVPTGWLDLSTNLVWKYENEEGTYTFDEAVARFGEDLPTKEEYEEAGKHGILEVLDLEGKWLWSASVFSTTRSLAWYFYSNHGNGLLNSRSNTTSVRCVGR